MTDNFEEFEQDQFEASEIQDEAVAGKEKKGLKNALNKPVVKLAIIAAVVGVAVAGALGAFSSDEVVSKTRLAAPPMLKQAPGGNVTPFFAEQNKMADDQRVKEAITGQGSALPTPIGRSVDPVDISALSKKTQLEEFQAETEKLRREWRAEKQQNEQKIKIMQQQMNKKTDKKDRSLATAMQKQMQQMMDEWGPRKLKVVNGVEPVGTTAKTESLKTATNVQSAVVEQKRLEVKEAKTVLSAGTVNYAQLLTEANSDVPGPIMVQILSGPFSGGRAIGNFKVLYEQLTLTFNLIVHKGKEYSVNAIALNPDTTLSGLVTEVDHRYFKRIVLPAAAEFVSGFGDALSSAGSQTTATGDSLVVTEIQKGYKEAAFEGLGKAGETISRFMQQEAAQTKTLVRVAPGTAMGLFFLNSVKEDGTSNMMQEDRPSNQMEAIEAMARAYQQGGYGALPNMPTVSTYPGTGYGAIGPESMTGLNAQRTPGGSVTIYK